MAFNFKEEIDPITGAHYKVLGKRRVKKWTEPELQQLRRLYPISNTKDLEDIFHVKAEYISRKASHLGIHKDKEWLRQHYIESIAYCIYKVKKNGNNPYKHFQTPEWRERMRKQSAERIWTDEDKQKLSASLKKYYHNPEHRKRQGEIMKAIYAQKKGINTESIDEIKAKYK